MDALELVFRLCKRKVSVEDTADVMLQCSTLVSRLSFSCVYQIANLLTYFMVDR